MGFLFCGPTAFNQDLSSWESNVATMHFMFWRTAAFNQDILSWDTSYVESMAGMFCHATSFNHSLSSWNMAKVLLMLSMFHSATSFNHDLSSWNGKPAGLEYHVSGSNQFPSKQSMEDLHTEAEKLTARVMGKRMMAFGYFAKSRRRSCACS